MKKYFLTSNGNILVQPEKEQSYFLSATGDFQRYATDSETEYLLDRILPEIEGFKNFNEESPYDWEFLWRGESYEHGYYQLFLRKSKCGTKFAIVTPDCGEYTRTTWIIGARHPFAEVLESDFDEVVLDQICGFLTLRQVKKLLQEQELEERFKSYKELKKFLTLEEIKGNLKRRGSIKRRVPRRGSR